jgi:hypothetical protein
MTTKTEVAAAVAFIFAAFNREANEMHVEAWWIALRRYETAEITKACMHLVDTAEAMPPVGAVIRYIKAQRAEEARKRSTLWRNQRIALEADKYRSENPKATAVQVSEFITQIEKRLTR